MVCENTKKAQNDQFFSQYLKYPLYLSSIQT